MRIAFTLGIALILGIVATRYATAQATHERQGAIVSVQKMDVSLPRVTTASDSTDQPLQTMYYKYNISVAVGCRLYAASYESQFDDLPSSFLPNKSVSVRFHSGAMYLDAPGDSVKTTIVSSKTVGGACHQTTSK
jgi:hypothetical protein